ncbi:MAG: ABC transporter permease, partial [Finegoldia magna]|nr:ABC transporter permease [Finegoldia magna]
LSASVLVSWIINFLITVIFIAYLKYGLKVEFGDRMGLVIGLASVSSLCGVTFGILIGVSNRKSLDTKIGIGIALTMLMSFLAGMMVPEIKVLIAENIPIINKINPVAVVTDAVYSLYYYDSLRRFNYDMLNLLAITVFFIVASLFLMRGKEYESL